MEELKDDYQIEDINKFIIENNEYRKKKWLKYCLIISPIVLTIIAIIIVIALLSLFRGGFFIFTYITSKDNEQVKLLNENIYQKNTIKIKQEEKSIAKTNSYIFFQTGKHRITIEFK